MAGQCKCVGVAVQGCGGLAEKGNRRQGCRGWFFDHAVFGGSRFSGEIVKAQIRVHDYDS